MKLKTVGIAALVSVMFFLTTIFAMTLSAMVIGLLFYFGVLRNFNPFYMLLSFAGVSLLFGTAFYSLVAKRVLEVLSEIGEATKEVAKGNFDIRLDEHIRVAEVRTMAQNFNLMAQELSKTEMVHSDFISSVSHEFKTPLSAIEGYATLLQGTGLSEEKRRFYTDKILTNVKRLSTLTGNILQLSRLENQEINSGRKRFSLDEQIRECLLLLEPAWGSKALELDIELDEIEYTGNPDLLFQVWQNLIGNAIKFSEKGGLLRVLLKKEARAVRVTVEDSGEGMSEETQKHIFEKFYQGDSSHATEGNGLGLALVKRVVELHGGEIEVSSEVHRGTRMTVTLPDG